MKGDRKDKGTIVRFCGHCTSDFQDAHYGPQKRVFNHAPSNKYKTDTRWRCSICGVTKEFIK